MVVRYWPGDAYRDRQSTAISRLLYIDLTSLFLKLTDVCENRRDSNTRKYASLT